MEVQTSFGKAVIEKSHYALGGRMSLQLFDVETYEPIATLTLNLPDEHLEPGEFFVKTWGENEEIAKECLASGLFEDTGKRVPTGWVNAEVWTFKKGDNNG